MKKALLAVGLVCALGAAANANFVTYSDSFDGYTDFSETLSVQQFDTSMGVLNGVQIVVCTGATGTISFENTGGTPATGTISTYYTFEGELHTSNGGVSVSLNGTELSGVSWDVMEDYDYDLAAFDGTLDFAGTSGFSQEYLNETDTQAVAFGAGDDLSIFIGNGTVDFDAIGEAIASMRYGNGPAMARTEGSASVAVTYNYTVPEPATMVLLGLGGLAMIRRKRAA